MANRMSNLELSETIKNYIKKLFDEHIKSVIDENTKVINDLKNNITELKSIINSVNINNDKCNDTESYANILNKNLEKTIENTIIKSVNKNISKTNNVNCIKKTIILYNVKEQIFNDTNSKENSEFKSISNIIDIVSDQNKNIKINKFHRIGKFNKNDITNLSKNRQMKIVLDSEESKSILIRNAYKLKNSSFNKVGISIEYSIEQLIQKKECFKIAKAKCKLDTICKVHFINNKFKLIYNNTDKKIYNTITKYYKYK